MRRLKGTGSTGGEPSNAHIVISSGEATAAGKAYERESVRGAIVGSVWGRKSWSFGSGGLFAMLPANAVVIAYRGTELQGVAEAYDPWSVFEPKKAIALAIAYNRSLSKWQGFKSDPTWENLHAGWRAPGNMGDPGSTGYQKSAANFREALAAVGIPQSFASKRVNFDGVPSAVQIYLALNGAGAV